jgi:hypothetical protein
MTSRSEVSRYGINVATVDNLFFRSEGGGRSGLKQLFCAYFRSSVTNATFEKQIHIPHSNYCKGKNDYRACLMQQASSRSCETQLAVRLPTTSIRG